jgi:hypothetical protein
MQTDNFFSHGHILNLSEIISKIAFKKEGIQGRMANIVL